MDNKETDRYIAEKLRLVCKEVGWALQNLKQIYECVKPADMNSIEDPAQLKLFDDEKGGIQ